MQKLKKWEKENAELKWNKEQNCEFVKLVDRENSQ